MATTAELTERLEALKEAMATGVLTVKHGEILTTYRSVDEMLKVIAYLTTQIAQSEGTAARQPRYIRQETQG